MTQHETLPALFRAEPHPCGVEVSKRWEMIGRRTGLQPVLRDRAGGGLDQGKRIDLARRVPTARTTGVQQAGLPAQGTDPSAFPIDHRSVALATNRLLATWPATHYGGASAGDLEKVRSLEFKVRRAESRAAAASTSCFILLNSYFSLSRTPLPFSPTPRVAAGAPVERARVYRLPLVDASMVDLC